jgi:hypothetical protein
MELRWLEHEADHLPPFSAMAYNVQSFTATPAIQLHGMTLQHKRFSVCTVKLYLCCTIPCNSTDRVNPIFLTAALDITERFSITL